MDHVLFFVYLKCTRSVSTGTLTSKTIKDGVDTRITMGQDLAN